MKIISILVAVGLIFGVAISSGCGGGGNDDGGGGSSDTPTTRNMTGTFASSSGNLSSPTGLKSGASSGCSGVAKVIATATDATTVMDDSLASCQLSLPLAIGKSYIVSFVNSSSEFVASLVGPSGSIFEILSGTTDIELGDVTVADGSATFSGNFLCYIDTNSDGTVDCEDTTPCGGDSCSQYYSCEYFGFTDSDGDLICDEWDGDIPSAEDMPVSTEIYSVGGTVAGLIGTGPLVLQNNGSDALTITQDGSFTFSTTLGVGVAYAVTVLTQPSSVQTCVVASASGNISTHNVISVSIECSLGSGAILTVAGNGTHGYSGDGGLATSAEINMPRGIAFDSSGNLFIADTANHRVRKVDKATGIITTVVGIGTDDYSGDGGLATSAEISAPQGIAFDSSGNLFIVTSDIVRKVDKTTGIITTLATGAELNCPTDLAVDSSDNLYIADPCEHKIKRVANATGIITTVAGNGTGGYSGDGGLATSAEINDPYGLAVDSSGDIYIADYYNSRIRMVDNATGIITTVAGNGTGGYSGDGGLATSAGIDFYGIAVDSSGNLFIADTANHRVRKVDNATGIITTVAGTGTSGYSGDGGLATSAKIRLPRGVAVDSLGNLYIIDCGSDGYGNNRIRMVAGGF